MGGQAVNVKVAVRARPLNTREKGINAGVCLEMKGATVHIKDPNTGKARDFAYDHAYWFDTEQEAVYKDLGAPILKKALEGYNGTIFAYGQTGAGKSFSMMGTPELKGIIPRINADIFNLLNAHVEQAEEGQRKFLVTVSYLEIYNEVIRDLLNPSDKELKIREHPKLGIYVDGLAELVVKSADDVERYAEQGNKVRMVGATKMNNTSSRSHSVFTLKIEQQEVTKDGDVQTTKNLTSKINLVDLAGSERAERTGATGDRLKEGAAINKSLSALGNVINALTEPEVKGKKRHIPYRDSKLTRILQESLGGNTMTVMLCALSPAEDSYDETLSTLLYANRAKSIKNNAVKNEDANQRVIRELREEIERLRKALATGGPGGASATEEEMQRMQQMESMIQNLEYAKTQAWEEKEKISRLYEAERKKNLASKGMLEMVMEGLKEENQKLKEKLNELQNQKEDVMEQYKVQKENVDKIKGELQEEIGKYQKLMEKDKDSAEVKEQTVKIQKLRKDLKLGSESLKDLKVKLKDISDQQRQEKEDMRAQNFILGENSELRKAIQDDERKKIQEENERILNEERAKMQQALEAERGKIKKEAEKRFAGGSGGGSVSMDEYVNMEMKLIEKEGEKNMLLLKIERLESQIEDADRDRGRLQERVQRDLEKQQLQFFQMFRRYREFQEERVRQLRKNYAKLTDSAVKDALHLSRVNSDLETELDELRKIVGFNKGK